MILIGSIMMYVMFEDTKNTIDKIGLKSNIEYIDNITSNISRLIVDLPSSDIYNTLDNDDTLRDKLEKHLQLFITQRYRYIYVVDKENLDDKVFRFLLDGAKNEDDKSEFGEEYEPLELQQWDKVYKDKRPVYYEHNEVESLWLTYLKPIVIDDKVRAIVVIDFSLQDHKLIMKSLDVLNQTFKISIIFALFIFMIIIVFAFIDEKRSKMLETKSDAISKFNDTLQSKIDDEVQKNRDKDEQIMQQSRLAQMGEMISMIAHQWRQPLGSISSAVMSIQTKLEVGKFDLSDDTDRDKFIAYCDKKYSNINGYVQFLSTTIDDFRNFFKPDKEKEEIELNIPLDRALQIVEVSMKNKGIEIIKDYKCKDKILMYQNEVMQVVLNIIKNAEDNFIEKRIENPQIIISTLKENDEYIMQISDNGGGIPAGILEKIFDPYFSTKKEKNGTGLGLYMSKTMIEEHHDGSLICENIDDGVRFKLAIKSTENETI